jgi:alpha-N-arabinofuranosidase
MVRNAWAALLLALMAGAPAAHAQAPVTAEVTIRADRPGPQISRYIYGQFAEHLGRGIYEGIWVGADSPIPNTRGLRNDVIAALRRLHVPVVRWPGGCFADIYHWRDGIGPRAQRPVRINAPWGGVADANAFGTHEFFDLVELIGADAYLNANIGTGSPQEMSDWLEYILSDSNSSLAQERRRNGRERPWRLAFLTIGNETWGCGGNMRPEYYSDLYRQYATFLPSNNRPLRIASGGHSNLTSWTEVMMAQAAPFFDAISLHYYTLPTDNWGAKGAATGFNEAAWIATLRNTLRMGDHIAAHAAVMDRADPQKRVGLYVDEWGTWYDAAPGASTLYQENTLRDAIVAALNFHIFHARADRVRMANIAQMVNVLQAMILTDGPRMVMTPTYHVFEMYIPFQDATSVPADVSAPPYRLGDVSVPSVHVSAARARDGGLVVALVNLDPRRAAQVNAQIEGPHGGRVSGRVLTAREMDARNTFAAPEAVRPALFSAAHLEGGRLNVSLPAKSVVVLRVE